jgi:hypothetical protein
MKLKTILLPMLALAAASPAVAQTASASAPAKSAGYAGLWTSWSGVSRQSVQAETEAGRRGRWDAGSASPAAERGRGQAAALGERVGEIVRDGDCEGGERVAREAGDFALVQAVRDHCRGRQTPAG